MTTYSFSVKGMIILMGILYHFRYLFYFPSMLLSFAKSTASFIAAIFA
jgi:hypothetical protein